MKLKDILKESKYLKREFGEALPTLDSVMKQHQDDLSYNFCSHPFYESLYATFSIR